MNAEIKTMISTCEICNRHGTNQQKELLRPHDPEESEWPFQKVGVDMMSIGQRDFLVTVDYYSGFCEVEELKNTKSTEVIRRLKNHFMCYGIPTIVVSDNGPQFHCEEFCNFAKSLGFMHRTSSPGHPKNNGMVQAAVKSAKKIISRAIEGKKDPHLAILAYCNTPQSDGLSPAQKFLGRRTRNSFPQLNLCCCQEGLIVRCTKR